jgi:hypothetical protein
MVSEKSIRENQTKRNAKIKSSFTFQPSIKLKSFFLLSSKKSFKKPPGIYFK